ncbi:pilin [Microbulbifer sp. CAU 1566]|nr:pilin [Microbulbifer sp. CAU 1566]
MTLASGLKTPVTEALGATGACPANTAAAVGEIDVSTNIKGQYVVSVATAGTAPDCTITAKFASAGVHKDLQGKSIRLTGTKTGLNGIAWKCTNVDVTNLSVLPSSCRGT